MKIAIINGHPREKSLSDGLTKAYADGAESAGAEVRTIFIRELKFDATIDPTLADGLEPDLLKAQEIISWSHHLCFISPTWWTGVPALMKGFIDRTFSSGWAFKYQARGFPKGLLTGRSARMIHTIGAPKLYNFWFQGKPQVRMVRDGVLKFCGFNPVKVTSFGGITKSFSEGAKLIDEARKLGMGDSRNRSPSHKS